MKNRGVSALLLALLILGSATVTLNAEVKVIILPDGSTVFQLDRSDMEKAIFAMEQVPILEGEIANLITLQASTQREEDQLRVVVWIVAIGGPILGFLLGHLLK